MATLIELSVYKERENYKYAYLQWFLKKKCTIMIFVVRFRWKTQQGYEVVQHKE